MPIYEFKCTKCGNVDELLMRFSDPNPEGCSSCGGTVEKLVSLSGFALKGTGWYVTDYKNNGAASTPTPAPAATSTSVSTPASSSSEAAAVSSPAPQPAASAAAPV